MAFWLFLPPASAGAPTGTHRGVCHADKSQFRFFLLLSSPSINLMVQWKLCDVTMRSDVFTLRRINIEIEVCPCHTSQFIRRIFHVPNIQGTHIVHRELRLCDWMAHSRSINALCVYGFTIFMCFGIGCACVFLFVYIIGCVFAIVCIDN